jgi:hypothetical protein
MHNHAVSPATSSANNPPRCPMSTSSTYTDLVSNPRLRKDRQATNHLSHCTAVILRDGLGLKHGYKTREMFHLQTRHVTPTYRPQAVSVSVVVFGEGDAWGKESRHSAGAADTNIACCSGLPRNFVRGGGVQQIQLRTEMTEIWGR